MTLKEKEALNQWLDEQLKAELIVELIKICSTMLLRSKEGQFTIAGSRLQKTKSSHYQRQNTTTTNRGGHRQIEGSKVLQETRSYLGLQQCADKRRQQMKNSFPDEQEIIQATDYIFQTM